MANSNIINAVFGSGMCAVTTSAFRANYGMVLRFSGIDLPTAFECDFSNYDVMGHDSITMIGQNGEVQIPDDLWDSGLNIYAYVYLHPTDDSGVTVYTVTIPVLGRPNRTEETPTPHEQTVIEQAISALNDAVEQTAADVVAADASAQAAAQSEANASVSERSAAASASAALASQNAAHASETASAQSAQSASGSAVQASQSAQASAESADTAQGAAASAERSEQNASASAASAQSKATEAASSAATASAKATEASASATAAAQSASSAASAAQNAAASEQLAESHATDAEQAKQDAQAAQAAAEQAAQSVSGLSAQIEQNTADIAELVQSKAGALIDTATGSIASFMPDATVPTVRGLTVNVEPVQDLHGYDHPWPGGSGKNLAQITAETIVKPSWYNGGWDGTTVNSNGGITQTRTYLQGGAGGFALELPEGAYMFSMEFTGTTQNCMFHVSSWDGTTVTTILSNERMNQDGNRYYKEFTVPSGSIQLAIRPTIRSGNLPYDLNKIQVESGSSTPTAYEPYSNICPISGWDEVEVQRTGVNVWNKTLINGNVEITDLLKPGETYTASGKRIDTSRQTYLYLCAGENAEITLGYIIVGSRESSFTFTVESGVRYWLYSNASYTNIADVQIELGSTATAYEPYSGDTYQIQLGQTVYGGTVDTVNGVLTVDRAMVDLGSLNWVYYSNVTRFAVRLDDGKYSGSGFSIADECFCSCYPALANRRYASQPDKSVTVGSSFFSTTTCALVVHDSNYTDANTFKTAVTGQQLVYELATPFTIQLDPVGISTISGQTNNVWADAGDVSVDYAVDLKTYIDQKIAAAVAALS